MKKNYWAVRLGRGGKYTELAKKYSYIAIGWNALGDLSWLFTKEIKPEDLKTKLLDLYHEKYLEDSNVQVGISCGQIWRFVCDFKIGDLVLIPFAAEGKVLMGEVAGDYQYKENWDDVCSYQHRRHFKLLKQINRDQLSQKFKFSIGALQTVFNINDHVAEIENILSGATQTKALEVERDLAAKIIDTLYNLHPKEFEEFIAHLLNIIGFDATPMQYVGDKGVDVVGVLNADGLANIRLRIQVKRIKGSVGIDEVLRTRGSLGPGDHGAVITLSSFTAQAQEDAQDEEKTPINLIDSDLLVDLILKHYEELDEKYKKLIPLKRKDIPLTDQFIFIE